MEGLPVKIKMLIFVMAWLNFRKGKKDQAY